jgi:hypothetical protein
MKSMHKLNHIIDWILSSRSYHYDARAILLKNIGVVEAAEFYRQGNKTGLLVVSGLTSEQFEQKMIAMENAPEMLWHKWRE